MFFLGAVDDLCLSAHTIMPSWNISWPLHWHIKKTKCGQNSKLQNRKGEGAKHFLFIFYSLIKNLHAIHIFFVFAIFVFLSFQNLAAVCVEPRSFQSCFRYFHPTIHSRHLPPTTILHNSNFTNIFFPLERCNNIMTRTVS